MATNREAQILKAAYEAGITSPRELANFMAQVSAESGGLNRLSEGFRYTKGPDAVSRNVNSALREGKEALNAAWLESINGKPEKLAELMYGGRMGNNEPGDGYKYHGRGYIQLTGKNQYRVAGEALDLDLIDKPELAAEPENAAKIAIWFWKENVQRLAPEHVKEAGSIINTGEKGNTPNGLKHREAEFDKWERVLAPEVMEKLSRGETALPISPGQRTASDPTVRALQQNLNHLGITDARGQLLTADGNRGGPSSHTNEAIATFQQRFGLERSQMSNAELLMASQAALNANPIRNFDQTLRDILPESMQPQPTPHLTNGMPDYLRVNPVSPPATAQRSQPHDAMSDGVLKQGESGPEVRRLQEALNQQGAHLPLTGNFRDQTKSAVEGFQRDHGLEVDGKAGRDTLNALGIGPSAPIAPMAEPPAPQRATPVGTQAPDNALRLGDRGTEVLALQASLIQLNINDRIKMPVEVNGVYGMETQRAVQAFQLWHGMDEVNGIADRATRDAVQQQASLAIAQRAIDQAQGQPVKDFATNASLGAQIDWRDAATLRDPNQSDSQPVPPPPAPAPARQVTARDYEALGWTPPYVSVASQSQEQSGHDHEQQEQQARQQQQHREWQVQQDQRMQEQGRLKEEETGREEERSKEQQPALRPFSDPKHPEHELYADLKQRLEAQGQSFPEDRLNQIVGALHDERFKPGWRGAVDVKNDSVYVRDNDRPWARSQTLLQEPAPSLQDTMQLVQQKDLEKAQQRSQSPDTPTQGPTR